MKIGVFDSGIGGLTVLKNLIEANLFSEIIYYGDTARVPYGNKDKETIIRFSLEALDFFAKFDIDLLVIACNTASAYALKPMQKIANFPIIGVVESGILSLSNKIKNKQDSILIIATKATIKSGIYERNLRKLGYENITSLQTGLFVPLVEEGIFSGELLEASFRHYFSDKFDSKMPKAIILACTHFPLIKNQISSYFDNKPILIHSGEAIVEFLSKHKNITPTPKKGKAKIHFYASGDKKALESYAKSWLKSY